ncbi:ester cyclase [Streptomyces sp. NPDC008092]|uniref:ester cyclase n=1 Tax=Streptomyces sp. NPDC008092 TaxID=3364808 RepID=UPI0036F14731
MIQSIRSEASARRIRLHGSAGRNNHDAENFIANVPGRPEPLHGREIRRYGTQTMLDAFPDLKIDVHGIFGAGGKVAVPVNFQGTHVGAFQWFEATGRTVAYRSVEVYRIEGDMIVEEWAAPGLISLMQPIAPTATDC